LTPTGKKTLDCGGLQKPPHLLDAERGRFLFPHGGSSVASFTFRCGLLSLILKQVLGITPVVGVKAEDVWKKLGI